MPEAATDRCPRPQPGTPSRVQSIACTGCVPSLILRSAPSGAWHPRRTLTLLITRCANARPRWTIVGVNRVEYVNLRTRLRSSRQVATSFDGRLITFDRTIGREWGPDDLEAL